jgi:transcriptional regulator with XRE-family HTH domain
MERTGQKVSWPRVKSKMASAGVSQAALARHTGMYQSDISDIMNGREPYVSENRRERMLRGLRELGVDVWCIW